MAHQRHGLSIGIERIQDHFILTLSVKGKLQHQDYQVMVPMLESAISEVKHPVIHALVDCTQLEGWELRAMWDDFVFGLKHRSEFEKIAIVGQKKWHEWAAKVGKWFVSGDVRFFEVENDAVAWIKRDTSLATT